MSGWGVPRALLILGAVHTLAGWALWLSTHELIYQEPLQISLAAAGLLASWGLLLLWLIPLGVGWTLITRALTRPAEAAERKQYGGLTRVGHHGLLCIGLLLLAILSGLVFHHVDYMLWVVCGLWVVGFAVSGAVLLVSARASGNAGRSWPNRPFTTARVLAPTAALAWSMWVVLDLLFHRYTGAFVLVEDINLMVHVMSDEAVAMLFGPSAPWFIIALCIYAGAASVVCFVMTWIRQDREPVVIEGRPLATVVGVGALGIALVLAMPSTEARAILHHVHPQVDNLAVWFVSPDAPDEAAEEAARVLYPSRVGDSADWGLPKPTGLSAREYGTQEAPGTESHANVLVIFIDTLSRQNLDAWGYPREVAPHIKALADRSTRFDGARTNGGTTDLATVSLFYGIRPLFAEEKVETYRLGHGGLPFHLLARAHGLKVGLFSGDWEVWTEGQSPVFPDHCDHFIDARIHKAQSPEVSQVWAGVPENLLVDELERWLEDLRSKDERFLAYLKLFRPHMPYYTPASTPDGWAPPFLPQADGITVTDFSPAAERLPPLRNRYDNAIHYADHQLGRVLAYLERSGLDRDTAIVLVADHGEAWGQHGWYNHGHHNFEEFLQVPLIVHRPGQRPAVDDRMVSLMDVAPTVLDLLGLPPYPNHQGVSVIRPGPREVYWGDSNSAARLTTLQIGPWKYTENRLTGEASLYDLNQDPAEMQNLLGSSDHAQRRLALRHLLFEGNRRQLLWADALRAWPTVSLLENRPSAP